MAFELTILLSFVTHALVAWFLRHKITKIKIISKIDLKITLQHKSQVNKLTGVISFLAALRVSRFICQRLAHWSRTNGHICIFKIPEKPALNQLIFFFQEPLFNLLLILPFLILFWRQRLSRSAQASLMAMNNRFSSFKNSHGAVGGAKSSMNHSKITSSSTIGWKMFNQNNGEEQHILSEDQGGAGSGWQASFLDHIQSKTSSTARRS